MMILYYCLDNFKYVSLIIGFNDTLTSFILSITTIFYIFANFLLSYLWQKYDFKICIYIVLVVEFIILSLILLS